MLFFYSYTIVCFAALALFSNRRTLAPVLTCREELTEYRIALELLRSVEG